MKKFVQNATGEDLDGYECVMKTGGGRLSIAIGVSGRYAIEGRAARLSEVDLN